MVSVADRFRFRHASALTAVWLRSVSISCSKSSEAISCKSVSESSSSKVDALRSLRGEFDRFVVDLRRGLVSRMSMQRRTVWSEISAIPWGGRTSAAGTSKKSL